MRTLEPLSGGDLPPLDFGTSQWLLSANCTLTKTGWELPANVEWTHYLHIFHDRRHANLLTEKCKRKVIFMQDKIRGLNAPYFDDYESLDPFNKRKYWRDGGDRYWCEIAAKKMETREPKKDKKPKTANNRKRQQPQPQTQTPPQLRNKHHLNSKHKPRHNNNYDIRHQINHNVNNNHDIKHQINNNNNNNNIQHYPTSSSSDHLITATQPQAETALAVVTETRTMKRNKRRRLQEQEPWIPIRWHADKYWMPKDSKRCEAREFLSVYCHMPTVQGVPQGFTIRTKMYHRNMLDMTKYILNRCRIREGSEYKGWPVWVRNNSDPKMREHRNIENEITPDFIARHSLLFREPWILRDDAPIDVHRRAQNWFTRQWSPKEANDIQLQLRAATGTTERAAGFIWIDKRYMDKTIAVIKTAMELQPATLSCILDMWDVTHDLGAYIALYELLEPRARLQDNMTRQQQFNTTVMSIPALPVPADARLCPSAGNRMLISGIQQMLRQQELANQYAMTPIDDYGSNQEAMRGWSRGDPL